MAASIRLDEILRARGRFAVGGGAVPWRELALVVLAAGAVYGATMGGFGLRPWQSVFSALKVPLLLVVATVVCLPSFFVVNTLLGLRADFAAACRGILAAQATLAVTLASLAPVTVLAYASSGNYVFAVLWNGLPFLIATLAGQATLSRHYRPLIAANPRHRLGRAAWLSLYVFVAVQMAWVLRPYVGDPDLPTRFFREGAWSNAYVVVARAVWRFVAGG